MGASVKRGWNHLSLALLLAAMATASLAIPSAADARYNARKAIWGPAYDLKTGQAVFPVYKELGVGIYSIALDWRRIARRRPKNPTDPRDPAYKWIGSVITTVPLAVKNGIRVNIQITHTPGWANGGRPFNWAPNNPKDYANFAVAAAKKFPQVHMWMVWGEPSRRYNFMPYESQRKDGKAKFLTPAQAQGPKRYARMVDATYGALKKLNRGNLIIAGNTYTAGDIRAPMWIRYLKLPNGKPPRMDLYGHNPFSFHEPNLWAPQSLANALFGTYEFSDIGRLAKMVNKSLAGPYHKRSIPLFLSEWCIPTGPDKEFNFQRSESMQAKWINSAMHILNTSKSSFIYSLGWIHLRDSAGISSGLLRSNDRRKAGFAAFANG